MKRPCWKCGGTGKNYDPNVTAMSICSVCGGTGVLDDLVYHPPVKAKACWYCDGIEGHRVVSVTEPDNEPMEGQIEIEEDA